MGKVLLVDTNISSSPIYDFLLRLGHDVAVIGGNPRDFLARTAKNYIQADYSEPETLAKVVSKHGFDFIVPGCNDRSYLACSRVNEKGVFFGLDSSTAAEMVNNKQLFRTFAIQNGLPVPSIYTAENFPLDRPLIVKPVDAFSGRGVSILSSPNGDSLARAVKFAKDASLASNCIIEEYVDGQLYSHSAFVQNGRVLVDFVVEEHGTANPFVVDTSRVIYDFQADMLAQVRSCIERMANLLQMVDGLVHTQFIVSGSRFWIIEVTRRCPGDLYSQLIELSTGIPYAELYARPFVDSSYPGIEVNGSPAWIMRHTISLQAASLIEGIHFTCPLLFEKIYPFAQVGDSVRESPFGRVGIIFTRSASEVELNDVFCRTLRREIYSLDF